MKSIYIVTDRWYIGEKFFYLALPKGIIVKKALTLMCLLSIGSMSAMLTRSTALGVQAYRSYGAHQDSASILKILQRRYVQTEKPLFDFEEIDKKICEVQRERRKEIFRSVRLKTSSFLVAPSAILSFPFVMMIPPAILMSCLSAADACISSTDNGTAGLVSDVGLVFLPSLYIGYKFAYAVGMTGLDFAGNLWQASYEPSGRAKVKKSLITELRKQRVELADEIARE